MIPGKKIRYVIVVCVVLALTGMSYPLFGEDPIGVLDGRYENIENYDILFKTTVTTDRGELVFNGRYIHKKPDLYKVETSTGKDEIMKNITLYDGSEKTVFSPDAGKAFVFNKDTGGGLMFSIKELEQRRDLVYKGTEKLNGEKVDVFQFDFGRGENGKKGRVRVYIAVDDGIIRKIEEYNADNKMISCIEVDSVKIDVKDIDGLLVLDLPEGTEIMRR